MPLVRSIRKRQALPAQTEELDAHPVDAAQDADRAGNPAPGQAWNIDVERGAAFLANEVMVGARVGVEAGLLSMPPESGDETQVEEKPEVPVNGVQGNAGHPTPETAVDGLGVGMLGRARDLVVDGQPLGRHPDAGPLQTLPEARQATSDLPRRWLLPFP